MLIHQYNKESKERYAINKAGIVLSIGNCILTMVIIKSNDEEIIDRGTCKQLTPYEYNHWYSHYIQEIDETFHDRIINQIFKTE